MTVVRRSMTEWHEGEGLFAISAYVTVLILPFLVTGTVRDFLGETVNTAVAFCATAWLVILFFMVTPYRMWADEYVKAAEYRDQMRPRLRVFYSDDDPACRKDILAQSWSAPRQKGVSLRAKVENESGVVTRACAGFLLKLEFRKSAEDEFVEERLYEPNRLPWALEEDEYQAVDVHPKVPKFLGVCGTREGEEFFFFRPSVHSLIVRTRFKEHGQYRFTLGVTSADSTTSVLRIMVVWNGKWNEVKAWAIEENLASKTFGPIRNS